MTFFNKIHVYKWVSDDEDSNLEANSEPELDLEVVQLEAPNDQPVPTGVQVLEEVKDAPMGNTDETKPCKKNNDDVQDKNSDPIQTPTSLETANETTMTAKVASVTSNKKRY